jgi:hypothetical protein
VARARAVDRGIDFEQPVEAAQPLGPLVDHVPRAGARRVYLAMVGGRSAAQPVAQALGARHGADESGLLQNTVAAHSTAKEDVFDEKLERRERPDRERIPLNGIKRRLVTPG